ncbi:MAG: CrcB family protein [Acidimicrobiia bacterium]
MTIVVAVVAGSVGAVVRYGLSGAVQRRSSSLLPLGTAAVNLVGAFLLGVVVGIGASTLWSVATMGLTGGLSTFSTWMVETVELGVNPRPTRRAIVNLTLMTVLGVVLAAAGYYLGN